jgi:prepilin-type processing-associated H-X9-DG protein
MSALVCPSDETDPHEGGGASGGTGTNYAGVVSATWDVTSPESPAAARSSQQAFFAQRGNNGTQRTTLNSIKDGTSNTIAVAEVYRGRVGMRTGGGPVLLNAPFRCNRWMATGSCGVTGTLGRSGTGPNISGSYTGNPGGFLQKGATSAPTGDGGPNDARADQFAWNNDNDTAGPDGYRPSSSAHTGGVQVLMADGSVHFISDNVDSGVYNNSISVNGGETENLQF